MRAAKLQFIHAFALSKIHYESTPAAQILKAQSKAVDKGRFRQIGVSGSPLVPLATTGKRRCFRVSKIA
jgi:aryl-alcohol dehydrogenase-like predicted oxidoreductase